MPAPCAAASNAAASIPGTRPVTVSAERVTVGASSTLSSVTTAVTSSCSGSLPPCVSSCESAIEKQEACAAAISSSGLVLPSERSVREAHVTGSSPSAPLPLVSVPSPFGEAALPGRLRAALCDRHPVPLSLGLVVLDDAVDQAVLDRLLRGEEAVALHVRVDLLLGLPGVERVDLVDPLARLEDLSRVDLDVGRLALEAGRRLVDQDAAVRQRACACLSRRRSAAASPSTSRCPTHIVATSGLMNCIVS